MNFAEVQRRAEHGVNNWPVRIEKSSAQWQEILTPEVYGITRDAKTERPFSSALCGLFEPGRYGCACCHTALFDTEAKFESHCGWPSFSAPLNDEVIQYKLDNSARMSRIEIQCAACDAHLGHVFEDGPQPTGLRYCVNGLALIAENS